MKQSLEIQRLDYSNRKFLATPLSGLIAWFIVGISGIIFPDEITVWVLFITTGSIVYLSLFISKFTGENFLAKRKKKNEFDSLFLFTIAQSILIYAIAIPFFIIDYTSLPLSIGILTGTMWIPFSWIIKHWIGLFHAIIRTLMIFMLWYLYPEGRFILIPFSIAILYILTLYILRNRNTRDNFNKL